MSLQDKEMLNDLVVESREHLSEIEPDLLELEQKGDGISGELINRIFRAVHSIKGGFGFFGIEHVTKLSHTMENVMAKIRDKQLAISPECTDALLKGVDKLRVLLDDVGNAEEVPIDTEVGALNPFLGITGEAEKKQAPKKNDTASIGLDISVRQKHPDLTDDQINEAVRNGKLLYQVTIRSHSDLRDKDLTPIQIFESWDKFCDVLDIALDFDSITGLEGCTSKEMSYSVVCATVLEPDLISAGTGIPIEQIYILDISEVRARLRAETPKPTVVVPPADAAASAAVSTEKEIATPKVQKTETKIEDALRVKVSLLNNLMNLAGELVLSRNQLMQSVSRKLSDAVEADTLFKNMEQQINQSCKTVLETAKTNPGQVAQSMTNQQSRIHDAFVKSLALRIIDIPGFNSIMQNIDMVTSLLQESIMQTRLQPISVVFAKFPRLVRDLAKKLDKEINLTLVGQDVELDKSIVEQLSDPLTHLIRNSVDHGVESQEARVKAGKPAQGEVVLRAFHEGGKVHIQIQDDGAGINRARVKQKAVEKKIITAEDAAKMTDREIDNLILLPGFSTAAVVSDVSGRGVGMDVVKTNIERLGGTVDIESVPGKGTKITMKLPLTLAIISSLIVSTEGRRFAIPQVNIMELVRIRAKDITSKIDRLKNCEVMRLRGKLLPLVRLADTLDMTPTFVHPQTGERKEDKRSRWSDRRGLADQSEQAIKDEQAENRRKRGQDRRDNVSNALKIIVLKFGEQHFGLVVEEVYDSEEIVVKPLSGYLKQSLCYAGSTIMGDGSVAMILDTNGIATVSGLKFGDLEKDAQSEKEKFAKESQKKFKELLLFSSGENGNFGLDLSMVARVEKVETSRIAQVGNKEFLKYDNRSMRVVRLSDFLPVAPTSTVSDHTFVIVPKDVKYLMGIVADQVRDVVKTDAALDTSNIRGNGIQGSAIINSALTIVIDVNEIFRDAEPELCG